MFEQFKSFNMRQATIDRIADCNDILDEYAGHGLRLTIRQLFYQLVSRAMIDNTMREYKKLVALCTKAREAGEMDWSAIEDRERKVLFPSHWSNLASILHTAQHAFRVDLWANQEYHVEVMLEKNALSGVLEDTCDDLDVRLIPNKGYPSASMMYGHAKRLYDKADNSKTPVILYLGDHDPSGLDMDRDLFSRLLTYSNGVYFEFHRIALTMEQIHEYGPPPNPTKLTDSRAADYIAEHGYDSWELDALDPLVLRELVDDWVHDYRDQEQWDEDYAAQEADRTALKAFIEDWKNG